MRKSPLKRSLKNLKKMSLKSNYSKEIFLKKKDSLYLNNYNNRRKNPKKMKNI